MSRQALYESVRSEFETKQTFQEQCAFIASLPSRGFRNTEIENALRMSSSWIRRRILLHKYLPKEFFARIGDGSMQLGDAVSIAEEMRRQLEGTPKTQEPSKLNLPKAGTFDNKPLYRPRKQTVRQQPEVTEVKVELPKPSVSDPFEKARLVAKRLFPGNKPDQSKLEVWTPFTDKDIPESDDYGLHKKNDS